MSIRSFTGSSTSSSIDRPAAATAGEILDRTVRLYRRHAGTFVGIALPPAATAALIAAAARPLAPTADLIGAARTRPEAIVAAAGGLLAATLLGQAAVWALNGAGQGAAAVAVGQTPGGAPPRALSCWAVLARRPGRWAGMVGALLAIYSACGLLVAGGGGAAMLVAGVLLAVWAPGGPPAVVASIGIAAALAGVAAGGAAAIGLIVRYALAPTRLAVRGGTVREAFASSASITRRRRGRALGILFVTGLVHSMIVLILQAPFLAAGLLVEAGGTARVWLDLTSILAAAAGSAATLPPIWIGLALLERSLGEPPPA